MGGHAPEGRVMIFDDDHYYLGSALAEHLAMAGADVVLVTPAAEVSGWTHFTLEYEHIQVRLRKLGVQIVCNHAIHSVGDGYVDVACVFSENTQRIEARSVVPVTARISEDTVYQKLINRRSEWADHGIKTVTLIGDSLAPGTIAMAVYAGHQFARELEAPVDRDMPFRRENDFDTTRSWPEFKA